MATNAPRVSNQRPVENIDYSKSDLPTQFGIFVGTVRKVDTVTRSGRLEVYIGQFGSANEEDPKGLRLVSYASPFMGTVSGTSNPYTAATANDNTFAKTQQSYGFYMTPPDVGSLVLCCFPPDTTEGYWFACITTDYSRNMVPAIGSVPWDKIDKNSVDSSGISQYLKTGNSYPVAEANKYIPDVYSNQSINEIPKPIHIPQTLNLIKQGLDSDTSRGAISSSAQRDTISTVFGFSTPGRPYGSQDPANVPDVKNIIQSGDFNPDQFKVTTRVGGHSLVLDDGDFYGKSNLVRLKTSAGHQILMNDSEGFMYIANSEGTAWIELTRDGDILVYGQRDLSIRNRGNIMLTADKNISMEARGAFQVSAGSMTLESKNITLNGESSLTLYGKQTQIKSQSSMSIASGAMLGIKSSGKMALNGSAIALNGGGGAGSTTAPQKIKKYTSADAVLQNGVWTVSPGAITSINNKIPTHEPYTRANATPQSILTTLTSSLVSSVTNVDINNDPISPPANVSTPGITSASSETLTNPAPSSSFISQTNPTTSIGELDKSSVRTLLAQIGHNNSNGNYSAISSNGLIGKYQLSSESLQSLGYLKPGTGQTAEDINNPNNWTGKNGIMNSNDYLTSPAIQDQAALDYAKDNYASLQQLGLITSTTTKSAIAGLLSVANNLGVKKAAAWATSTAKDFTKTAVPDDTNNGDYGASELYNQGEYSQTQVAVVDLSNASTPDESLTGDA